MRNNHQVTGVDINKCLPALIICLRIQREQCKLPRRTANGNGIALIAQPVIHRILQHGTRGL
jgi:hypothetical protein